MTFRKSLFWLHLAAGVSCGLVVGIMCLTGSAIAFEDELVGLADGARHVQPPTGAMALGGIDDALAGLATAHPDVKPSSITVSSDPGQAIVLQQGRGQPQYYLDRWTGELRPQGASWLRSTLHVMETWHRWLGMPGAGRDVGRAITGFCNAAFFILLVTGIYLWMPRPSKPKPMRTKLWFVGRLKGKAREWNWHMVIGFWTAPVLLVLIASGIVMSYGWANALVYRAFGEAPPQRREGPPGRGSGPRQDGSGPNRDGLGPRMDGSGGGGSRRAAQAGLPAGVEVAFGQAAEAAPGWDTLTLQLPANERSGYRFTARGSGWPWLAGKQVTVAGDSVTVAAFSQQTPGRQARTWLRFLHTGEAFGFIGKLVATVASLGGAVLVWTGIAMAIRRWQKWRRKRPVAA